MPIEAAPSPVASARAQLIKQLLPEGVPQLWCPPLTHYKEDGSIDKERMAVHFKHVSRWVRGFLVPGSTGDGWELSADERRQIIAFAVEQAQSLGLRLLLGALKLSANEAIRTIHEDLEWLNSAYPSLVAARVCGFTVCPPHGKDWSQAEVLRELRSVLDLGLPLAIYQLPQVTENELSPESAAELAGRFANFIFFKDTSGKDRVALSGLDLGGVFLARGFETDYARWLEHAGGPYHGFLLGAANCFACELDQVIQQVCAGRLDSAQELSKRLESAFNEVFSLVTPFAHGNAFANANKAMDHFFAYGPGAASVTAPRLHSGRQLPLDIIKSAGQILIRHGFMPERGYLE
ncbi:MAG: dihydrodipicolinate synthase family protein [Verrucomicrobia bacterium]|nr:MAG: dihydrodipicolinate synthase family protein [Verrucomicrobiota bacterium]